MTSHIEFCPIPAMVKGAVGPMQTLKTQIDKAEVKRIKNIMPWMAS